MLKNMYNKTLTIIFMLVVVCIAQGSALAGTSTTLTNVTPTWIQPNIPNDTATGCGYIEVGRFSTGFGDKIVALGDIWNASHALWSGVGNSQYGTISYYIKGNSTGQIYYSNSITLNGHRSGTVSLPSFGTIDTNDTYLSLYIKNNVTYTNPSTQYCSFSISNAGNCWNVFTLYLVDTYLADSSYYAQQAATNATTAANAANTASTNATSALNAVSNANGNTVTAVRDASGTALTAARQANTNAQNAYNAVNNVNGNTITAVRDSEGSVLDASRSAISKIDTLQTTINNYMAADTTPPTISITTLSGARATSGNSIQAVVSISDNVSTVFTYSLDGTVFQPFPADGTIILPVNSPGSNLISVWVRDEAGNTSRGFITIRKI